MTKTVATKTVSIYAAQILLGVIAIAAGAAKLSGTGLVVQYELPGWQPAGPEAFELVTSGNETALVLLSGASLDLLTICS